MSEDRARILRGVSLFAKLREEQLNALAMRARRLYVLTGERLIAQGSDGDGLYVVVRGRLKVSSWSAAGRESSLGLEGPGSVIGELSMLDGEPRSASVTAIEDCEVLVLGRNEVLSYLERNASAAMSLVTILATRLRRLSRRTEDLASNSISMRLARLLLELADEHGEVEEKGTRIPVPLSQQELGKFIDATRESVNKHLRLWQRQGLLLQDRVSHHITIFQRDVLEEVAREGEKK